VLVGTPAQGVPVVAVVQFQTVAREDRQHSFDVARAVQTVHVQAERGQRPGRGGVDQCTVGRVCAGALDQRLDQAEHRFPKVRGAPQTSVVHARRSPDDTGLDGPVREVSRGGQVLDGGVAALGERGQEIQHRPIGDELEIHVTILTGDARWCKSRSMSSPVEQVTRSGPGSRRNRARLAHYLAAALLARTADEGARVALVILALDRTGSAAVGGMLVATLLIPHIVAAPLVGALIDRSRRPAAVLAGAVAGFAGGLAAPVALLGHLPLWFTYLVLAVTGCCGPAITGGLTSRLATLAGPGQEARAFGLDSLFYNVASMAGPAAVGLVAATGGPSTATLTLALAAVLGALAVATLRLPATDGTAEQTRRAGLFDGAREIARNPALRTLTLTTGLGQLGPGGLAVVATTLAAAAHEPARAGLLLSVIAGGAFVGSLLWTWRPLPAARAPGVSAWAMVGVGVPIALAATVHSWALITALFALSGLFTGPFAAALFLARSQLAAEAIRTQVFTVGAGLKVAAAALGAGLLGLASHLPASAQLLLVAASPIVAGTVGGVLLGHRLLGHRLLAPMPGQIGRSDRVSHDRLRHGRLSRAVRRRRRSVGCGHAGRT